ncbi:hypothetical protein KSD_00350 [Ktedonobacter sp. SOSP1-85]|nr:hypothetical protein KSD_00350 [Ktedonobacter sp. SOSP1-85]
MDFRFGALARGDIDPNIDEVRDVVIRIFVRGDLDVLVTVQAFPELNQGLEPHGFSPASSRDGGTQLLLTGWRTGPPPGLGERVTNDLLASDARFRQGDPIDL